MSKTTAPPELQLTSPEARQSVIASNTEQYIAHHTRALVALRNAQEATTRQREALDERTRLQREIVERQERLALLQPEIGKWEDLRVREEAEAQRARGVADAFGTVIQSLGGTLPPIDGSEAWITGHEQPPTTDGNTSVWTPATAAGARG